MSLSLDLPFLRVRPSGLPHGDTGCRPPELLPSPPPSGWSTGFMATPRVCGRLPFQRLRPALPIEISPASLLPTDPDRRAAVDRDAAHLGRRKPQRRVHAFLGDQLDRRAGAAAHLAARTRLQLDVVHGRADRDVAQRQRVADADLRALAALHHVADREALRGDDVALLAVEVVQQRDARVAVRVVLDRGDLRGNAVLVPLEVDRCGSAACDRRRGDATSCGRRSCGHRSSASASSATSRAWSFVTSAKSEDVWKRRPGLVGLRLRIGIVSSRRCRCAPRRRRG